MVNVFYIVLAVINITVVTLILLTDVVSAISLNGNTSETFIKLATTGWWAIPILIISITGYNYLINDLTTSKTRK